MRIRTKKITETHLQCAIHFNVIWLDTINITNIIVLTAIVIVFYVQTKTSSEKTTPSLGLPWSANLRLELLYWSSLVADSSVRCLHFLYAFAVSWSLDWLCCKLGVTIYTFFRVPRGSRHHTQYQHAFTNGDRYMHLVYVSKNRDGAVEGRVFMIMSSDRAQLRYNSWLQYILEARDADLKGDSRKLVL